MIFLVSRKSICRRACQIKKYSCKEQTAYNMRIWSTNFGERFIVNKWLGGSNLQETSKVFCSERARDMWVSNNGHISAVSTHFRAATVQQICISNTCLVSFLKLQPLRIAALAAISKTGRGILDRLTTLNCFLFFPHAPVSLVLWL